MTPQMYATPTVIATLLRSNGFSYGAHPESVLRTALQRAGIPPDAPYVEWCDMVGRALTLLPSEETPSCP